MAARRRFHNRPPHKRVHKRPANASGVRKAGAPSSYKVVKTQLKLKTNEKEKAEQKLEEALEANKQMRNELDETKVKLEIEKGAKNELEKLLETKGSELLMERDKRQALVEEEVRKRMANICSNPMGRKLM